MTLTDDQRAMLQLLLERGQSYDDIASLLGLGVDDVRTRARSALTEIGGADPDKEVGLTDYLLGQADPIGRADVARHLQNDGDSYELAEKLVTQLRMIAPKGELPQLPAPRVRASEEERPAGDDGAGAAPAKGFAASLSSGQRRLIFGLLGGAVVVLIVVLIATGTFSGSSSSSGSGSGSNGGSAGSGSDQLTRAVLRPVGGGKASGVAAFAQAKKVGPVLTVRLFNLTPISGSQRYGFWLVGKGIAVPIGGTKPDQRGAAAGTTPLPPAYIPLLQSGAIDSVQVTRVTAGAFRSAAQQTLGLLKALSNRQRPQTIPKLAGQLVAQGKIVGPGFTSGTGSSGGTGAGGAAGGSGGSTGSSGSGG
jgi:hypothetical protein